MLAPIVQPAPWRNGAFGPEIVGALERETVTGIAVTGEVMDMATEAYCVKCREKREIKDPQDVTMKNGRNAVQGTCPVCGTKLFRMVGKKDS